MGGCYAHPIVIEDNVWVGAGVHIMGGVTVGRNSGPGQCGDKEPGVIAQVLKLFGK
ncbi:hypothetical protein RJT03_14605 [Bacteroides thetaiotaomicron]|uniref:hypothetical protein n=1 Tax=Bacteroides thetaiotaomicron TaxID=818 RepID=UPI0028F4541B|nr:hypothetical protein [Bacteroides thetaiotaomicron]WOG41745.1 hypothetical protein RJT03_14605 [Bacteroides thetaiotaomicron]